MSLLLININVKSKKKLIPFLKKIYGIGSLHALQLCKTLGYDVNITINNLREEDIKKINSLIAIKYKYPIDTELKKRKYDNVQIMKNIKCYKGVRHLYNLPVNGQKTHNNAKTRG